MVDSKLGIFKKYSSLPFPSRAILYFLSLADLAITEHKRYHAEPINTWDRTTPRESLSDPGNDMVWLSRHVARPIAYVFNFSTGHSC